METLVTFTAVVRRLVITALVVVTTFGATPSWSQEIPEADVLEVMIKENLITFNDANLTGIYDVLQKKTATPFQEQFTPVDLAGLFKGFVEQEIDIAPIVAMDPIDNVPPSIEDGILVLDGHFATSPLRVSYVLKFLVEDSDWRLVGIDVNARPPGE